MSAERVMSLRPCASQDYDCIARQFLKHDFYYSTKRPNSLSIGAIKAILNDRNRKFYSLEDAERRLIGLCDLKTDPYHYRNAFVEFRVFDEPDWQLWAPKGLFLFLEQLFNNHNFHKVTKFVYEFDVKAKAFFEAVGFSREATLKDSVFKHGTYRDIYIYSLLQENFSGLKDSDLPLENASSNSEMPNLLDGRMLKLRRLEEADIPLLYKWEGSENTYLNISDFAYDISDESYSEALKKKLISGSDKVMQFIVETRNGHPIGTVGLYNIDWRNKHAELIVIIGEEKYLGLGFGVMASTMLQKYAFLELNLHCVHAKNFACNRRVMETNRHGNVNYTAHLKRSIFKNGDYHDVFVISELSPFERKRD